MSKGQALKGQIFDEFSGGWITGDMNEIFGSNRGEDVGLVHILAGQRDIAEGAVAVEEPLTGLVQGLGEIFDMVALIGTPVIKAPGNRSRHKEVIFRTIHQGQPGTRGLPRMISDHRHIIEPVLGNLTERFEVLTAAMQGPVEQALFLLAGFGIHAGLEFFGGIVIKTVG
ncbi:MAG: hypothetical protein BWY71_01474 [Planctomycetes bacterium ADurb.Bin412]|nr:MAG: hypothetical protein BWY71_01474 [Planctomycetes bacterium ADurb.Bin412]